MNTVYVERWKQYPLLKHIVSKAFPAYRKQKVGISTCDSVTLHDLNWSGGTRNEYVSVDAVTGTVTRLGDHMSHPAFNTTEGKNYPTLRGFPIVRGGIFCGKESTLTIYATPADAADLQDTACHPVQS